MEAYRSYPPDDQGYPDDRGYPAESRPPEPGYPDGGGWYGERRGDDPPAPEPRGYEEPPRPAPARVEPPPPRPEPVRAAAPPPGPPPGPLSGSPLAPLPGFQPGSQPGSQPGPLPRPLPGEEPSVARRAPVAPGSPGPASDGVYRSRRPAAAALVGVPAAVLEIPALLLLFDATFGDQLVVAGIVSASCLVLALPLLAMGLYAVATGAVRAAGPNSAQAWLRPPVAYLTVALVLFIAAGLAA